MYEVFIFYASELDMTIKATSHNHTLSVLYYVKFMYNHTLTAGAEDLHQPLIFIVNPNRQLSLAKRALITFIPD